MFLKKEKHADDISTHIGLGGTGKEIITVRITWTTIRTIPAAESIKNSTADKIVVQVL